MFLYTYSSSEYACSATTHNVVCKEEEMMRIMKEAAEERTEIVILNAIPLSDSRAKTWNLLINGINKKIEEEEE